MLKTPQVRFSAVKKHFPRAHIEIARNVVALQQYVTKQDTRQSGLPTSQEKYPSLSKLWVLVYHEFTALNYLDRSSWEPDTLWHRETAGRPTLELFDDAIHRLIRKGYHVESLAVNPATRSMFKTYWSSLFCRVVQELTETDRQTDTRLEDEVTIPTLEHNNANDYARTQGGLSGSRRDEARYHDDHQEDPRPPNEGSTEGTDSSAGEEDDF